MELSSDSNRIKLTKFTDACDFITMQGNEYLQTDCT